MITEAKVYILAHRELLGVKDVAVRRAQAVEIELVGGGGLVVLILCACAKATYRSRALSARSHSTTRFGSG
eukprot:2124472-Pleurochrysis_carterae.AAC.1